VRSPNDLRRLCEYCQNRPIAQPLGDAQKCASRTPVCERISRFVPPEAEGKANEEPTKGKVMTSFIIFLARLVGGLLVLAITWFVFDTIHDRNTEITVATLGLQYAFIFMISRRLQYFGLTIFSFLGRTSSYIKHTPYDQIMRDEVGIHHSSGRHLYLNVIFAALMEILCLFRLFTSLLGRGWDMLSVPLRELLHSSLL
jgi:hypothetical protein